jgi:hypothetical protein
MITVYLKPKQNRGAEMKVMAGAIHALLFEAAAVAVVLALALL